MAQHDMNIANQGFPATRADLNNALQALVSNSSGTSAPSTTFANQWWYDTTNNKMYIRNEANNAWIEVAVLDQTNNEWQITTGVVQAKDSDGLALKTDDGTTRLFIKDSDGKIGIGTTSATYDLTVVGPSNLSEIGTNDAALRLRADGARTMQFYTNSNEAMRINSSGNVGIGEASPDELLHMTTSEDGDILKIESTNAGSSHGPNIRLLRNSSSPADDDMIGRVNFNSKNSADEELTFGQVLCQMKDVTDATEDSRLKLGGLQSGSFISYLDSQPTETVLNSDAVDRDFRVKSDANSNCLKLDASHQSGNGAVMFISESGTVTSASGGMYFAENSGGHHHAAFTNETTNASASLLYLNRDASDGTIVEFRHANSTEGTISISGSTVSYNGFAGRHESSGIANTVEKGTVLSTIDELDTYPNQQYNPDNDAVETLSKAGEDRADHAKVKISDTVGDARVYGVVDDFTDQGKVNVIGVGIGAIKVTGACVGGDLLESNGDGTAKVQSDDIIRSKTIGKVTIGNSDTGVKLVSCVLYCG